MIVDIEVWRVVSLLIDRHGYQARTVARARADQMLAEGDRDGQLMCTAVVAAIDEWQRTGRHADERQH